MKKDGMKQILVPLLLMIILTPFDMGYQSKEVKQKTALLLIDIQNFYFPGGQLPLVQPDQAARQAQKILKILRKQKVLIVHIRHMAKSGAGIHKRVKPLPGEKVFDKRFANSFRETDLLSFLQQNQITHLVLAGMQTHMCLEAAVRAAADLGFKCTVIGDACATRDLRFNGKRIPASAVHLSTLASLSHTYARVIDTETFLKESKQPFPTL
jgi:nicotinamidase-related amidase